MQCSGVTWPKGRAALLGAQLPGWLPWRHRYSAGRMGEEQQNGNKGGLLEEAREHGLVPERTPAQLPSGMGGNHALRTLHCVHSTQSSAVCHVRCSQSRIAEVK